MRLEVGQATLLDPLGRCFEQRAHEAVQLILRAVIGVQRDVDVIRLGDLVRECREGERTGHHVLDALAGEILCAAGGDLDDAVAAGVGETLDGGVQGLAARDVDGRVGEAAFFGPIEHLGVLLRGRDRHGGPPAGIGEHSSAPIQPPEPPAVERPAPQPVGNAPRRDCSCSRSRSFAQRPIARSNAATASV